MTAAVHTAWRRAGWFTAILLLVALVGDGFSGWPRPLIHQLLLLPVTFAFCVAVSALLLERNTREEHLGAWSPRVAIVLAVLFELVTVAVFAYEGRHSAEFGCHFGLWQWCVFALTVIVATAATLGRGITPNRVIVWALVLYAAGVVLAISGFPLHSIHEVGPYLPGMLVAYWPAVVARIDVRMLSLVYLLGSVGVVYGAAREEFRLSVAALLAAFLLCPFLQFRHELCLQPQWLAMLAGLVLMQRRRYVWGAFVFGLSMGILSFSWAMFPFLVLFAMRRSGWSEALKVAVAALGAALVFVTPFLRGVSWHVASSAEVLAQPMNLSYWMTCLMVPAHLVWFQVALVVTIFSTALVKGRCGSLASMMRWSLYALVLVVMSNRIVLGDFYLMLLVPMLFYVCVANEWLVEGRRNGAK